MIAAPFLGEFGWEVAMWVPWLRWMRNNHHAGTDLIVMCRPGHGELYKDFATKIVEHEEPNLTKSDCVNGFVNGVRLRDTGYIRRAAMWKPKVKKARIITPLQMNYSWPNGEPPHLIHKEHKSYGKPDRKMGTTFVIHARNCSEKQPERNWWVTKWIALLEQFREAHVFAIGSNNDSLAPPGTKDFRGAPLETVVDLMASADFGIGPSSGPLHLMNACATPVVWWSGNRKDKARYERVWNPLGLPNVQAAENWNPEPQEVAECLKQQLSR